jgi:hypothetical protein
MSNVQMKAADVVSYQSVEWEVAQWDGPRPEGYVRIRRASTHPEKLHDFSWARSADLVVVTAAENRGFTCDGPRIDPFLILERDGNCGRVATHHNGQYSRHYCDECSAQRAAYPTLLTARYPWLT